MSDLATLTGTAAATLGTIAWLPQVAKTYRTRHVEDLSLLTTGVLFVCVLLWIGYGLMRGDWPIIIANGISALCLGLLLVAKALWSNPKGKGA